MRLLLAVLCVVLAGCASAPSASTRPSANAEQAAGHAQKMVGKPYKYGGASPSGFDCSGLIYYSFRQAGVALPHSTEQQRKQGRMIKVAELRRGDLLFFDQEGKKNSHVGIYLGAGAFVHAPSTGKSVRSDALDSAYWKRQLSEARRFELN